MIDAKELKKGNKVLFEGMLLTIKEIKEHEATFEETPAAVEYPDIDAIPLTPELLEACGFVKSNPRLMPGFVLMRSLSFDKYRRFRWDSSDGLSIETVESGWIWNLQEIRCLHQFQNLVHALTNTELEVNPKAAGRREGV